MIDPNFRKNRERIEQDEKELEELMKAEEEPQEEETEKPENEAEVKEPEAEEEDTSEDKKLSKEEQTFKKRYGDLRRHQAKKDAEWEEKFAALENKEPVGFAPPKSNEDLEAWAKKYPDVAGIVETIASKKAQEMFEKTNSRFKELDDLTYETKRTKAETQIRKSHSDFDTLKSSDDFHDWAEEQPTWIKNALYDNEDDASGVIRVIDLYKTDKGMTPNAKKAQAKDAAADVKTKGSPKIDASGDGQKFSESQVNRESDSWYEKNADKIAEAMNTGNFIYDITRK
tara:strand:+ start:27 stop:881 length:855 start_codon:yes stop_codon:yes gene_type:complete